jgi:hypothetical protein
MVGVKSSPVLLRVRRSAAERPGWVSELRRGKALLECAGGEMNATQSSRSVRSMVAGDEFSAETLRGALCLAMTPSAKQRLDHGASRRRHADIPADSRRVRS